MRNYNEMAESALKRIKEHEAATAKRTQMLVRTLIPAISFCVVAVISFGVWQSGIFTDKSSLITSESTASNKDKDSDEGMTDADYDADGEWWNNQDNTGDSADKIGSIVYNGTTYVQLYNDNIYDEISKLQTDKYLGNAKSFEGYYKNGDIDGKVYTVKRYSNLLLIYLDNGGEILLKAENNLINELY